MLLTVILGSLIILGVTILCFVAQRYFTVQKVELIGDTVTPPIQGYDALYRSFLPLLKESEFVSMLANRNPQITDIALEKRYPDTVLVTYRKSIPTAVLASSDRYYLLTDSGRVLSILDTKPEKLPVVTYYQQFYRDQVVVGDSIETKDIQLSLSMVDVLESLGFAVKEVDIKSFYMIRLVLSDSREIYISTEKQFDKQVYQIRSILKKFKVDGTQFRSLDVRFDKPVIKQ